MHSINVNTDQLTIIILPETVSVIVDVYGMEKETLIADANRGKVYFLTRELRAIRYSELEEYYEALVSDHERPTFVARRK